MDWEKVKVVVMAILAYLVPTLYLIFYAIDFYDISATIITSLAIAVYAMYLFSVPVGEFDSDKVRSVSQSYWRKLPRLVILIVSGFVGAILLVILVELPESQTPTLVNLVNNLFGLDRFTQSVEGETSPYIANMVIGLGVGFFLKVSATIDNRVWEAIDNHFEQNESN